MFLRRPRDPLTGLLRGWAKLLLVCLCLGNGAAEEAFFSVSDYDPEDDRLRIKLEALDANMVDDQVDLEGIKLAVYLYGEGKTNRVDVASPSAVFDSESQVATSSGMISLESKGGNFLTTGQGWRFEFESQILTVSNLVKSTVRGHSSNDSDPSAGRRVDIGSNRFRYEFASGAMAYQGHVEVMSSEGLQGKTESLVGRVDLTRGEFEDAEATGGVMVDLPFDEGGELHLESAKGTFRSFQREPEDQGERLFVLEGDTSWRLANLLGRSETLALAPDFSRLYPSGNASFRRRNPEGESLEAEFEEGVIAREETSLGGGVKLLLPDSISIDAEQVKTRFGIAQETLGFEASGGVVLSGLRGTRPFEAKGDVLLYAPRELDSQGGVATFPSAVTWRSGTTQGRAKQMTLSHNPFKIEAVGDSEVSVTPETGKAPWSIRSERATVDLTEAVFDGNASLDSADWQLRADDATAQFNEEGAIVEIKARGNVDATGKSQLTKRTDSVDEERMQSLLGLGQEAWRMNADVLSMDQFKEGNPDRLGAEGQVVISQGELEISGGALTAEKSSGTMTITNHPRLKTDSGTLLIGGAESVFLYDLKTQRFQSRGPYTIETRRAKVEEAREELSQ